MARCGRKERSSSLKMLIKKKKKEILSRAFFSRWFVMGREERKSYIKQDNKMKETRIGREE